MLDSRRVLTPAPKVKVLGSDIKTHLESRFRAVLILYHCVRLAVGGARHGWAANTMWRTLLYSGFHAPKAVAYHEPTVMHPIKYEL